MRKSMVWEEVLILIVCLVIIGVGFIVSGLTRGTSNEVDNNIVNNTVSGEGQ